MKTLVSIAAAVLLFATTASATTTINDNYYGGTANNPFFAGQDIVGLEENWDVSHMDVTISTTGDEISGLQVVIYSQFFDNVGKTGIELGDLFISTDGWQPFGASPYNDDTFATGEDWEIAVVLDNHGEGVTDFENGESFLGESGNAGVYSVDDDQIELSALPGRDFRQFQEVQYNPASVTTGGLNAKSSWSIVDMAGAYDALIIDIAFGQGVLAGVTDLGFHWTMTCGNDVIEGGASVPEPSTMILLGMALLGGAQSRRKRA